MYFKNSSYQLNETSLTERNEETLEHRRTYKAYWKRALTKIKISRVLQKLSAYSGDHELFNRFAEIKIPLLNISSRNRFIFLPFSYVYLTWVVFLALCMVYLCSYGIFIFSFYPYDNSSRETSMEVLIDFLFIIDIIFSLNLAYFDEFNNLTYERSKICKNYMKTFLLPDLISALPLGIILRSSPHEEFSIIFMFRHIPKLFKWIKIRVSIKNFSLLKKVDYIQTLYKLELFWLKLILVIMFAIHIVACIFFLVARADNFSYDSWVTKSGLIDSSVEVKYLTSLYWAIVTLVSLGYGDIHPYTQLETVISLLWELSSMFIISYSISTLTIISSRTNQMSTNLTESLYFAEQFSQKSDLPRSLTTRLKIFIRNKKLIKKKETLKTLLNSLNPTIKLEIALNMHQKSLSKIDFFSGKSHFFLSTVPFYLDFLQFNSNEYLFHSSSASDSLFFIVTGRVKMFYQDTLFFLCKEGEILGDLEVFSRKERKFDALCVEFCKVFRIFKENLQKIEEKFPQEFEELKEIRKKRKDSLALHLAEMICLKNYQIDPINGISHEVILREKERLKKDVFSFKDENCLSSRAKKALAMLSGTEECINNCQEIVKDFLFVENLD